MNVSVKAAKRAGIVGVVLFVIGIFGWISILQSGPEMIELTESAQWGLLVSMFFFFEALGSGCLIVGALKEHAPCTLMGVASIMGACVMILMDLYHPVAAWRLFLAPNLTTPMFLDVLFSALCIVFGIVYLVALVKKNASLVKVMGALVIVVAILFPLGTSWLCTTLPGQLGWSTIDIASFFIAVGVCAGAAMAFFKIDHANEVLIGFLAATFVLLIAQLGLVNYGTDTATEWQVMREVVAGKLAPLFWTIAIAFTLVPLILCLVKKGRIEVAAALAVAGVACDKYLFAVRGNLFPYLILPDVKVQLLSYASGYPAMSYFPHLPEWLACIGAIGFVIAVVAFVMPKLTAKAEQSD